MDYMWFSEIEEYLNNLLMFKYVHDHGIDVSPFKDCTLVGQGHFMNSYTNFGCFMVLAESMFADIEHYESVYGSSDLDSYADKEFWLSQCSYSRKLSESDEVIVIFDSSLQFAEACEVGESRHYGSFAELHPINNGVILVCDNDDGPIDFTEVMKSLIEIASITKNQSA